MNAKKELQEYLKNNIIKCANIKYKELWSDNYKEYNLKVGYTKEQLNQFFQNLDFTYDNGFGAQSLFGIVWLKDNSWLEREGYNGTEWWKHKYIPKIPESLL